MIIIVVLDACKRPEANGDGVQRLEGLAIVAGTAGFGVAADGDGRAVSRQASDTRRAFRSGRFD
jgi:hypothetical protein